MATASNAPAGCCLLYAFWPAAAFCRARIGTASSGNRFARPNPEAGQVINGRFLPPATEDHQPMSG